MPSGKRILAAIRREMDERGYLGKQPYGVVTSD